MRLSALILIISLSTGCATVFKSARQQVFFQGAPSSGTTIVQSPDGKFEIEGGSGSYLMTRTHADIPIAVTCPGESKPKQMIVETKFDWLVAGAGNLVTYGLGWFVDPFNDKSYDIPKIIQLGQHCPDTNAQRQTASEQK
jgi:hypothetical protein